MGTQKEAQLDFSLFCPDEYVQVVDKALTGLTQKHVLIGPQFRNKFERSNTQDYKVVPKPVFGVEIKGLCEQGQDRAIALAVFQAGQCLVERGAGSVDFLRLTTLSFEDLSKRVVLGDGLGVKHVRHEIALRSFVPGIEE